MANEILTGGFFMPLVSDLDVYVVFQLSPSRTETGTLDGASSVVRLTKPSVSEP